MSYFRAGWWEGEGGWQETGHNFEKRDIQGVQYGDAGF